MSESSPKPRKPAKAGQKSGPKPVEAPGLATRRAAVDAIDAVLDKGRPLEEALERLTRDLDERDRSLARMIAATVLRRLGTLRRLMRGMMEKPLPSSARRTEILLLVGAAQILRHCGELALCAKMGVEGRRTFSSPQGSALHHSVSACDSSRPARARTWIDKSPVLTAPGLRG